MPRTTQIQKCIDEQARAAQYLVDNPDGDEVRGAALGVADWMAKEVIERTSYESFLESKHSIKALSGFTPSPVNPKLFPFQRHIVERAIEAGKFAIFSECGTGKTAMQLEWARQVSQHTSSPVLILAPLAVTEQTRLEGVKFGIPVTICRNETHVRPGINITNYEMLKHFDANAFGGVVLDESSVLKNFSGATKRAIIEAFAKTQYKLACTATPAPNDHMELGNHSEFLDVLDGTMMLSRWFLNDTMKAGGYRLKKHGAKDFWRWVASYSVCVEKPSDIGYSDDGWVMQPLRFHEHIVPVDYSVATDGMLFRVPNLNATGLHKEMRLTAHGRARSVAELVDDTPGAWIIWCNTNYEADELTSMLPAAVEVRGDESMEAKERKLLQFGSGDYQQIITKPSIAGFGLNWQHCHNMAFAGLSYSYEQLYQAVRRSWRYGQTKPVNAHMFMAETEGPVMAVLRDKQKRHEEMKREMVGAMAEWQLRKTPEKQKTKALILPEWMKK
jgi:hypothetical protein